MTGGHHFVHLSVQKGPFGGLEGLDVSVRAVAGLGQRGAPLLTGSVDKLIDFISVSHTTPNPYWPDIHMFTVQRITLPPSSVSLFFLPQFFSPTTFFCLFVFLLHLFHSLSLPLPPFPFEGEHFKFSPSVPVSALALPLEGGWRGGRRNPCFLGHSSG